MNLIVVTSTKQNIKFGYEGEDNVTKIIFPYDESWLEYGEGNFEVRILRCGDEVAYTATDVVDDRQAMTLTMTVTDIELSVRGRGEMQLCYVCPDSIKKSPIYQYTVNRSVDYKYAVDPPEGSIIASVEKSLSEIKNTTNRLSNSVISIESSINDVNSQIDNINNKISEFDEEIDSVGEVETKVDNLETSIESINGRINTAEGNINENTESISDLNESVTELENRKVTDLETSGGRSDSGKYLTVGTDGKIKATSLTIPPTITVDTSLSTTSKNPVQNKVIKTELNNINSNIATCNTEISKINGSLGTLKDVVGEPNYTVGQPIALETANGWYAVSGVFTTNNSYLSAKVPVEEGDIYAVSTAVQKSLNFALAIFLDSNDRVVDIYKRSDASEIVIYADEIVTVPNGAAYMCITTLKASMNPMLVKEAVLIPVSDIANEALDKVADLFEHKNLINQDEIALNIRYSSATNKLANDITNYSGTGMIPVEEGEMYTFSGTAAYFLGAYFGEGAKMVVGQTAISPITFFNPVTGSGKVFTVPEGQDIKYVSLVLLKANGEVNGTYQLEKGEMATEIVPYSDVTIKKSLLPAASVQPVTDLDSLPIPQYDSNLIKSMQKFRDHWAKKDKDLVVVGTGTSLTARGAEHCTSRADASSRPPLMDSNNFASAMWDKMRWEGQQYRRYDYTGFFTETGSFLTSKNLSDWDDANYHDAWTRYCNGACSVAYTIPVDAWRANFIYRTDTSGSESVTVSIAEGNGVMQVWDGLAWVEANGYTFSMRETPVILPSVSVPNPRGNEDNSNFTLTNYQVSGNTTYQKRLKMRAVTRAATKTVTIASETGRFMYWGVEWSVREFMITYINSARGSHNMTVDSGNALQKTQDNEIWSHKPDLIFCENPIHNSGGSGSNNGFVSYYSTYWKNVTYDFFFNTETNPVSLMSRAIACGIDVTELEWCIFNSSISWNFGGIDEDGLLKIQPDRNGRMITALDAQMMSQDYLTDSEKCVSINACKYWVDAAFKMFGNLKAATQGSGKDGATFTNEGSHWNDTGCTVMARCIGGVFDFYN